MKKDEKVQKKNVHHTHTVAPIEIVQTSSVELKRNAKGETEIRVKVYNTDSQKAMIRANQIFLALTKKHKYNQ